jgi:hypothetical protein
MFVIHFEIGDGAIRKELINATIDNSSKNHLINNLLIICPSTINFIELKKIIYKTLKNKEVSKNDFIYLYNFNKQDNDWFCHIVKKKGLKRVSNLYN